MVCTSLSRGEVRGRTTSCSASPGEAVNPAEADVLVREITDLIMAEKIVIMLLNSNPDIPATLGAPFFQATVAAAMEGRFLGLPAIAVSMTSYDPVHYETGVRAIAGIIEHLRSEPLRQTAILNVNVPDVPWGDIRGSKITRLGNRHKSEGVIRQTNPRGETIYWVGPPGAAQDAGEGTDFYAVEHNFISITPLQIDLTRYDSLHYLEDWLDGQS